MYHPLHVGNEWIYKEQTSWRSWPSPPAGFAHIIYRTVLRDTLINGVTWKIVEDKNLTNKTTKIVLEFYDSVTTNYYVDDKLMDSVSAVSDENNIGYNRFDGTTIDTIFSQVLIGRNIRSALTGFRNTWKYSFGLGKTSETYELNDFPYTTSTTFNLVYAKINGKEYGTKAILYADSLSQYHPLHNGNTWVYKHTEYNSPLPPKITFYSKTVVGDTLINGKVLKTILRKNFSSDIKHYSFERFDDVTGNYIQFHKELNKELVEDSTFTQTLLDIFGEMLYRKRLTHIYSDSVLGSFAQIRSLRNVVDLFHINEGWKYAYGFGLIEKYQAEYTPYEPLIYKDVLVYANVNGKEYGTKAILYADSLSQYHPLHTGNTWVYKHTIKNFPNPPTISYFTKTVTGDTLINGKVYKIVEKRSDSTTLLERTFERFDDLTGNYIHYYKEYNKESVEDSTFSSTLYDIFSGLYTTRRLFGLRIDSVFGVKTLLREINIWNHVSESDKVWRYAYGFGSVYEHLADIFPSPVVHNWDELVFAKINGKEYGTDPLSVERIDDRTPTTFLLSQNFPNPFNPTTTIQFSIPISELVTLKIYDILGKEVSEIVNETKEAGTYFVRFNASSLASGVYFYKISAGHFSEIKKMSVVK